MSENKGDLISREAVLKELEWYQNAAKGGRRALLTKLLQFVDALPVADAMEVVRCKDCKHHCIEETECGAKYIACNRFDEVMEADDFCSYGERKDGAGNGKNDP